MKKLEITVHGVPIGQGRARAFLPKGSTRPRMYDPSNSREWKQDVKYQAGLQMNGQGPFQGALSMTIHFKMPRPKLHFGARGLKPSAPMHHTKKPDLDNLVKAIKDALKGLCYLDDSQVCSSLATKEYGDSPGVIIYVMEV